MKDLSKLNNASVFGVYNLVGGNILTLFYFKDKAMYCEKIGNEIIIPEKFKDDAGDIKEMYDYLRTPFGLPRCTLTNVRALASVASETEIVSAFACPRGFVPVSQRLAIAFLTKEGFSCSALEKSLPKEDTVLDYTELMKKDEAQAAFERIKNVVDAKKAKLAKEYLPVAEAIRHGKQRLIYLVGPAGTGKTMLTYLFSQYCGAPLLTYQGSEGVEKDELVGCSDVNPDSKDGESPYRVVMGPLLRAYIEGWHIVIDEANYLLPSIMSCINSMVDDTPTYEFKGKIYNRHPNFVLYLTSNPGYEGTYVYNPATKSRGLTLLVDKLTTKEFAKRMVAYTDGKLSTDFFTALNKVANYVQEISQQFGESSAVCLRHAQNFCNLILARPCSMEDFRASFRTAYLSNALSMDKDNAMKVADVLQNSEFNTMIEDVFSKYDYASAPDVDPSANFADFVGEDVGGGSSGGVFGGEDSSDFENEFNNIFGNIEM